MNRLLFLSFLLYCLPIFCLAQDETPDTEPMRVVHCGAIDKTQSVQNIYADENNTKWVGTSEGLYQIYSADNSGFQSFGKNDWALMRQRGGNSDLVLATYDLKKLSALQSFQKITEDKTNKINVTFFNKKKKTLWIGTTESGFYRYKVVDGEARLLEHLTADNSKLKSNHINDIFVDRYGRWWVATDQGILYGEDGKWRTLYEKRSKFLAIAPDKTNVWLLEENFLHKVDSRNRWTPGDIDPRFAKGRIRDIAYDSDSKLWVASDIIVRYDVVEDKVEVFDENNGFNSRQINCILVDEEDALWVGTEDQGLYLIEKESAMTVICSINKPLSCAGSRDDAELLVKIMGGTPPYQYQWKNEFSGPNPANVGPGYYEVKVIDANGLERVSKVNLVDERLKVSVANKSAATRAGAKDGWAELDVQGGKPAYKYRWDSGETKAKASRLSKGQHQVTVSDRAECEYVAIVKIEGVSEGIASTAEVPVAANQQLDITYDIQNELNCANDNQVGIEVLVTGGTAPYVYQWNNRILSGAKVSNLNAGTYTVSVTDAKGLKATQDFYLEAPDALEVEQTMIAPVSGSRKTDGIAQVNVRGGTPPYSYEWQNGHDQARAERLAFGDHLVTVTDGNNCIKVVTVTITKRINTALVSNRLRKGQTIRLEKLFFEADSTNMTDASIPTLNEIYLFMEKNPNIVIEVGGHTNSVPPQEYCDRLSTARAKSISDYLQARGIKEERAKYKGYGKRKPIASNKTNDGRRRNQRVEIKILALGN